VRISQLELYGLSLGTAFQIQDDILDIVGDASTVGKTLGLDLEKGKLTLPIIHYLRTAPSEKRHRMRSILENQTPDRIDRVRDLLLASDSIAYARHCARAHVSRARAALTDLPESNSRRLLDAMAEFVADRAV
jgi:octaprenyl-diphosphate synthase